MSGRLVSALALAGLAFPFPWHLPSPHLPVAVERWLYNPRERTQKAIAESKQGPEGKRRAIDEAETALRLAPDDPLVQYDGGTAHLAGDDPRGAAQLLDRAAQALARRGQRGDIARAAAAHYNLGNAHLARGDAAVAVEAYKQALREAPGDRDAKWNLELALRERDKERARLRSPQEGSRGDRGGGHESTPQGGGENRPGDAKSRADAGDTGKGQPKQGEDAPKPGEQGQGSEARSGSRPQPARFHDLPEMSAAEASAILESVENLERQHRRAQAAENARRRSAKVKDW
jgi:Ca-activated chloride channel family protein